MKAASLEARPWSPKRWGVMLSVLFVGQVILLVNFGRRGEQNPSPAAFPMRIAWLLPGSEPELWSVLPDPGLLALPHHSGFSGEAWLRYPAVEYRPATWTEPPRWFELAEAQVPTPMRAFLPTNPPPLMIALQTAPPTGRWPVYVPPPITRKSSTVEIEGGAGADPVPALPAWQHNELLSNTVVRLLVERDGSVFSAALLAASGLGQADHHALKLARGLRLLPAESPDRPEFRQVLLRFHWQTLPPDAPAAAAPSTSP